MELWTPGQATDVVEVEGTERVSLPSQRKAEGGSHFDDELMTEAEVGAAYAQQVKELLGHLNERPDHIVYVGSIEDRENIRQVFNWWKREGALVRHPNIRIDYGVAEGAIRVGE